MAAAAAAAPHPEDFMDITSVKLIDLRSLEQDEIQRLARHYGDVPSRLHDLVNVLIDKSLFNESAGSRKQTFDRDRLPRNKDRHFPPGSASAQLHLATTERHGRSHKDLILHFCRQLHIGESGDMAMNQPNPRPPVSEGNNRGMNLKKLARVPLPKRGDSEATGCHDLHISTMKKKMKPKEEARRRAAEIHARAFASELEKHTLVAVNMASSSHEEHTISKDKTETLMARLTMASRKGRDRRKRRRRRKTLDKSEKRIGLLCNTCLGTFANSYSLRRHLAYTGHVSHEELLKIAPKVKKANNNVNGESLRCVCGNTYATPFTLRRHAVTTCVALNKLSIPPSDEQELETYGIEEDATPEKGFGKSDVKALLPKRSWKDNITQFKCRHCLSRFARKKHYLRHLQKHFKRAKQKMGMQPTKSMGGSDLEAEKPLVRSPNLDGAGFSEQLNNKRKHDLETTERRVRSRTEEDIPRRTLRNIPPEKPLTLTCQECGKLFSAFSRYSGHLSMHSRLRKVYVADSANAMTNMNMLHIKDWSDLGFRRLLNESKGTYLSGLPARLLFLRSPDLVDQQSGEI